MLGYLGYLKLDDIFLLANSSGMNRVVNPIISQGVWGAGWYNSATVAYADSQQNFEGTVAFELQAIPSVWNMIADWLVEQRVFAKSFSMSPNGVVEYFYNKVDNDPRSGAWCSQASFNIDAQSIVTVSATAIALIRQEVANASTYTDIRIGPGTPTGPLNPSPRNLNPIPGHNCYADITWPNAPPSWSTSNLNGFVMMNGSVNVNNNSQVIRGCTADPNPMAVLQGSMAVDGSITLWRNGQLLDPYGPDNSHVGSFTASEAHINMYFGGLSGQQAFLVRHVLLTSDAFDIQGMNSPTVRTFGFTGLGDGQYPPFQMTTT